MSKESERFDVPNVIRFIRNHRVVLDSDLAKLYGVTTKRLNEAVKRNGKRFPSDFMFRLESQEVAILLSQLTASKGSDMRSQIATALEKRNIRHPPYAFTEHGAAMAAMVLNSQQAIDMSVFIVRAFMLMREQLLARETTAKRLAEIEKTLLTHDAAIIDLYEQMQPFMLPSPPHEQKRIGFNVKEKLTGYCVQRKPKPTAKKQSARLQ